MLRRLAPLAGIAMAVALVAACGTAGKRHAVARLDARALVVQPRAVGGVRVVRGSWPEFVDEGAHPLADAFRGKQVPPQIAFTAEYVGLAGSALNTQVDAIAVVLPDAATARRLLAETAQLEGFMGGVAAALNAADPPGDADAAVAGSDVHGTVTPEPVAIMAWTKGRLYGYVSTSGDRARARVAQIAQAQEARFAQALAGDRLTFDALLRPPEPGSLTPFPPPLGRTVHPTATVPRIDRPGRYSLTALGAGQLVFSPAKGETGIQFPVVLALPPTPRGRWLWRITTHVVVTLARGARIGQVQVSPHISHTGAPGAQLVVARDLGDGRTVLVEETRHTLTTTSLEVRVSAMMGGNPSPRQAALVGFAIGWNGAGAERSLARITVLPDSAIEVFDDPAKVGREAFSTTLSKARP
jgi:hypothetical protein